MGVEEKSRGKAATAWRSEGRDSNALQCECIEKGGRPITRRKSVTEDEDEARMASAQTRVEKLLECRTCWRVRRGRGTEAGQQHTLGTVRVVL